MAEITRDPNTPLPLTQSTTPPATVPNTRSADTSLPNDLKPTPDAAAISPNAPDGENAFQEIAVSGLDRGEFVRHNCLDAYMNVTYGISLAMVSQKAVRAIDTEMNSDASGMSKDDYIVFASTGDIKTNTDTTVDYYNIKSLVFTSFVGHLPQNPLTAIIWDAKMVMVEPHGFSFHQDIQTMMNKLGYDPVAPWNFVYRLEVWFSGFDAQTGRWIERIPIPVHTSKTISSIVYYLTITTIDAQVTTQGSEYQISMQMYSHKTLRADALIYRAETTTAGGDKTKENKTGAANAAQPPTIKFGGTDGEAEFGGFIKQLVDALKKQVLNDTEQRITIIYEIFGPEWLMKAKFDHAGEIVVAHGSTSKDATAGTNIYQGRDIDIFTTLYQVMAHLPLVRKQFLREENPEFTKPSIVWNVRTNIKYTGEYNPMTNGFNGYKFQYYFEPFLSFRSRMTKTEKRNDKVAEKAQQARAQAIVDYRMLLRIYDFMFTNNNSEVIDFHLRYKNFYQEPFPNMSLSHTGNEGQDGANVGYDRAQSEKANLERLSKRPDIDFKPSSSQDLATVLGIAAAPQSSEVGKLSYAAMIGDPIRSPYMQGSNLQRSDPKQEAKIYNHALYQYHRYDMLSADMTVRFDPLWLMNPYMVGGDRTGTMDSEGGKLYVHTDRVIFIKAFKPSQSDFMNPNRTSGSSETTPFLGGFYQVLTVVNDFNGGKFTQKLNIFKYPHLNGFASLGSTTGV